MGLKDGHRPPDIFSAAQFNPVNPVNPVYKLPSSSLKQVNGFRPVSIDLQKNFPNHSAPGE